MTELLRINNLIVSFEQPTGELVAVKGVDLKLDAGETLALVGESGCGKTVLCKSMLNILCDRGRIKEGEILLEENSASMVFQDPMTSLDPAFSVGDQIAEVIRIRKGLSKAEAKARAIELMKLVQIDDAEQRYDQRPYQFSGGMRQRIVIAIALAAEPKLLLADEPTTALDEETQKEILKLIKDIQKETGVAVLFITHDLSIVEEVAERVAIMKEGMLVEQGLVSEVFASPQHEYTKKLLGYLDYNKNRGHNHRGHGEEEECLISVKDLNVSFKLDKHRTNQVLKDFNLDIHRGEIVGLIGKSGCGKSTLARCIMGLEKYSGDIEIGTANIRMIFQDTGAAFNDRMTIGQIVAEPLVIAGTAADRQTAVAEALKAVELDETYMARRPYELSGGQRQRVAIARALITNPEVIIADEPLTGLDVSTQAQIVHLFKKLSAEKNMAILFIAHDLPMVNHISDRVIKI